MPQINQYQKIAHQATIVQAHQKLQRQHWARWEVLAQPVTIVRLRPLRPFLVLLVLLIHSAKSLLCKIARIVQREVTVSQLASQLQQVFAQRDSSAQQGARDLMTISVQRASDAHLILQTRSLAMDRMNIKIKWEKVHA